MKKYTSHSVEETQSFAQDFANGLVAGDIVTLSGELGAGKTTYAQGMLSALGAEGPFVSPTFMIVKVYDLAPGTLGFDRGMKRIYHIDAYRLSEDAVVELGWSDIISDAEGLIIIEWAERISTHIPARGYDITCAAREDESRDIVMKKR